MGLMDKKIIAEVPKIERIDVLRIDPFVNTRKHLFECFCKKIFGVLVSKHAELGHASTDDRYPSPQFSPLLHWRPPFGHISLGSIPNDHTELPLREKCSSDQ